MHRSPIYRQTVFIYASRMKSIVYLKTKYKMCFMINEVMDLFLKRMVYYYTTPSSIRPAINYYIFAHRPLGSARKTRPSTSISLSTMQRRALRIASIVGVPVPEARIVGIPDENRVC